MITESTPLTAVIALPEFDGFGGLILPNAHRITKGMTVADTGRLLQYHSNIHPSEVAQTLNRLVDGVRGGEVTFHRPYEDAARVDAKSDVGLFFFRGRPGAPFAVISPGGGMDYVGSIHEGFPYTQAITGQGLNVFVLVYRVRRGGRAACEDLAAAIDYVFEHRDRLRVGAEGYSLWGSSAGARLSAALGSYGTAAFGRPARPRPVAVIMAYTGYTDWTPSDPATFAVVGDDDWIAWPDVVKERLRGMRGAGIPVEFHLYPGVGHGFGLGTGTSAEGWIDDAVAFWDAQSGRR